MSTVIKVENLSKYYRLGLIGGKTLHDDLNRWWARVRKQPDPLLKIGREDPAVRDEYIWALRDVSFEVKQGEIVGIIGRNGAGKSTLLKILSRITAPASGLVKVKGQIASLLEVGTGFHPELTGRENIYLNGTIMGMKKAEIDHKFDEIVAFAGVEEFIDTPVKRYSSGMYVRLAFAVAANLEPEILVIDEVLAVGDAEFQQKCIGKMGDVAKGGRTVLFVSHNMAAVQRLCDYVIILKKGEIRAIGTSAEMTASYLQDGASTSLRWKRSSSPMTDAHLQEVYISDKSGRPIDYVTTGGSVGVVIDFFIRKRVHNLQLSVGLLDSSGEQIFGSCPQDANEAPPSEAGQYRAIMYLPPDILMAKTYGLKVVLWQLHGGVLDNVNNLRFSAQESASLVNSTAGGRAGMLALRCDWCIEPGRGIL